MGVSPVDFLIRPDSMAPTRAAISDPPEHPWPRTVRRNPREAAAIRDAVVGRMEVDREVPVSAGQIARELGLRHDELYRVCPDLLIEISSRYRSASRQRSEQRVEGIRGLVRDAVERLHAQGVYPSVNSVRAILPQKAILRLPVARQAWLDALREHGWEMGGRRLTDHEISNRGESGNSGT
jgi:hypothetical protein